MDFTVSSEPSVFRKTAARAAAEGALVAITGALLAGRVWTGASDRNGLAIGIASAWAASSASVAWLLWARGRPMPVFWRAFGGGMVLRAGVLGALAWWGLGRAAVAFEVLLLSYVCALLALLLTLEMRHFKIR
ncbi:MAG: hypothetical protein HY403_02395 [Elusimicrobia bacterium]|nr:hypothetical protein [Elusimicrobiota bacterium]